MRMKNKKAEQIASRQKHRDQLKAQRRGQLILERAEATLHVIPTILIVCEGINTEPSYFNQFRLSSAKVKSVGDGGNPVSVVNMAHDLSTKSRYDQVWCVFDKDSFTETDFNNAIKIAESYDFGVAYSNQAFEYWLILHFNDHQGVCMNRSEYNDKINRWLKPYRVVYDGNGCKRIEEDFFELLDGVDVKTGRKRVEMAIARAERNFGQFDHANPAKEESSTTVFRLVQELLKYV